MKPYADYSFYHEQYHGEMEELDFQRWIISSTQFIRYATMGRSDSYTGDELKYAACEVADIYHELSEAPSGPSGLKKSESNDGYSVSFVVEGKDGETREAYIGRKAYYAIRKWLISTGLLSRKVGCGHDHQCGYYNL